MDVFSLHFRPGRVRRDISSRSGLPGLTLSTSSSSFGRLIAAPLTAWSTIWEAGVSFLTPSKLFASPAVSPETKVSLN